MINQNTIKNIKKSFNEFVTTNKETNIYDETKNIIGSISEDTYLELENTKTGKKETFTLEGIIRKFK